MERACQNIYQIYQKSNDIRTLKQNLKSSSFYIGDFLQKYEFVEEIGKGGHDNIVVKSYTEIQGHKIYAVKSYNYHIEQDKDDLLEFIIETYTQEKIQKKIDCAYINNMKGFFIEQDDDVVYFNMILDYGDGNLDQLIKYFIKNKTQKLEFSQLIKIFQQQLTVLKICEENQITHRDIKPSNIIYRKDFNNYTSQLADFGEASKNENLLQTRNTTVRGTPQYLSSELLYAYIHKQVDVDVYNPYKSDTYSLGLSILSIASCNNYSKRSMENMVDPKKYNQSDIGQEDWKYLKSINQMFDQFKLKYKEQPSKDIQDFVNIIKMCLCYNPKYRNTTLEILNQFNIKFQDQQPYKNKYQEQTVNDDIKQKQRIQKTKIYSNGDKYEGEFKDGNKHGQGTFNFQNGDKYVGDWKDDNMHGQGTYYYQNGNKYVGEFKDGNKHGQGTFHFYNGDKYVGDWKDDNMHGQGTYYYQNGNKYVGEFKDGNKHGQGTFHFYNGDKYVGEFKDDKRHGQGTLHYQGGNKYEGEWKDDKKHGQGTLHYQNGNKYEGEFKDSKRHGQGTLHYQNGNKYEGEFKDSKRHGQGTLHYQNGDKYEGEFKDSKRHGQGTLHYQNGDKYVGVWADDKKHGQGTYHYQGGNVEKITYQFGQII